MTRDEIVEAVKPNGQPEIIAVLFAEVVDYVLKNYGENGVIALEQQNIALQARIKDLEDPKTCDNCKHNNHLASETDPCNSCMRRMLYVGYSNDSYELKTTK